MALRIVHRKTSQRSLRIAKPARRALHTCSAAHPPAPWSPLRLGWFGLSILHVLHFQTSLMRRFRRHNHEWAERWFH
jgi:hypothetical protein